MSKSLQSPVSMPIWLVVALVFGPSVVTGGTATALAPDRDAEVEAIQADLETVRRLATANAERADNIRSEVSDLNEKLDLILRLTED